MKRTPLLLDIKHSSLDDGPGIRSVVFFKGCPLRCVWCQNPEALSRHAEIQRDLEACVGCGDCQAACPHGVARPAAQMEAREACQRCGACVPACPAAARRLAGAARSVEQVLEELMLDEPFYRRSGGGVTLSGGEPTLFVDFAGQLARRLSEQGVHVLLETCGQFEWPAFAAKLLPYVSTVYFDLKLADPGEHRHHCGSDNRLILANLERLVRDGGAAVMPRVPLVPGITDSVDNLTALAGIITGVGLGRVMVLPYHPLWLAKRRGLSLPMPYAHERFLPADAVGACKRILASGGLEVVRSESA